MARNPRSVVRSVVLGTVAAALALVVVPVGAGPAGAQAVKCPVKALAQADGPVDITMWHSMNRDNETTLQALTDEYNASQSKVKVQLLNTTSYEDTFTKYRAGLSSGNLPDIVQLEDTSLQGVIDSQSVVPVAACIKADKYPTADFIPRVLDYYTVGGTLYGMPFNVSISSLMGRSGSTT